MSYTAIIDVTNADEKLRPGMTAKVALAGAHRENAVRIPNRALAFRPSAEVLETLDEPEPATPNSVTEANGSISRSSDVWKYDGKRFTPVAIHIGVADDKWTELVGGSIRAGDALVTNAVPRR